VIVGRRATFGAPFRDLPSLRPGDRVTVVTGQGTFRYRIDVVRLSTSRASTVTVVPARLTLVTSDPAYTPDRKVIVSAALLGKAQPRSTVPTSRLADQPGEHSSEGMVWLLLWSQLALLLSGLTTWLGLKGSRRAVWIGALPLLAAVLWHVFENLALLLPNTL
jgi:sortase A